MIICELASIFDFFFYYFYNMKSCLVPLHLLLLPSASGASARMPVTLRPGETAPNCLNLEAVVSCKQASSS